jgi:hypothetical protein
LWISLGISQMTTKIQLQMKPQIASPHVLPSEINVPKIKLPPMKIKLPPMKIKLPPMKIKLSAKERWILVKQRFKKRGNAIKLEWKIDAWAQAEGADRQLREFRRTLAKQGRNICFGINCKGHIMNLYCFSKDRNECLQCSGSSRDASNARNNGRSSQRTIYSLKSGKFCEKCGCDNPILLDFDHIDPKEKTYTISHMQCTRRILEEVTKTRLLCVMCHRLHTQSQWKSRSITPQSEYVKRIKLDISECIDCKREVSEETLVCFDFDHQDSSDKVMNISQMVNKKKSIDVIQNEISKCDLRCASCHRLRTAKQFNFPIDHKPVEKVIINKVLELCSECTAPVSKKGAKRCGPCARMENRKVKDRPDIIQLKSDFIELNTCINVGKKYGVSDTAVSKWIEVLKRNMNQEDIDLYFKCRSCLCDIKFNQESCQKCLLKVNYKENSRPSLDQLNKDLIDLKTYVAVGSKYGVTNHTIRYWLKYYATH